MISIERKARYKIECGVCRETFGMDTDNRDDVLERIQYLGWIEVDLPFPNPTYRGHAQYDVRGKCQHIPFPYVLCPGCAKKVCEAWMALLPP